MFEYLYLKNIQTLTLLSQHIVKRDKRFLRILGTLFSWFGVIALLSTGQVGCLVSHSCIHAEQKACSHWGAWRWIQIFFINTEYMDGVCNSDQRPQKNKCFVINFMF